MKIAIYPGSFNPWHEGHSFVLNQALQVFDKVIVARGLNADKLTGEEFLIAMKDTSFGPHANSLHGLIEVTSFTGLLVDYAKQVKASAVIKGLRNGQDLEYERSQEYWNEHLGLRVPTFYVMAPAHLLHVSSSAIRTIETLKKKRTV